MAKGRKQKQKRGDKRRGGRKSDDAKAPDPVRLTRDQSRRSKPIAHEYIRRKELTNGKVRLTFLVPSRGVAKLLLRLPEKVEKTIELDAIGVEIFDLCDGETTVDQIVGKYSKTYKVDRHEAEIAVTTFMRTLVQRGLITMMVPKS